MKKNYLLIILSCFLLTACSSGKNRLVKGDYDTAVYKAVKRLNQKANYRKAEKVLREAYTLAVNEHMERIAFQDQLNRRFKYDAMTREYELIDHLNRAIRRYPMYKDLVTLVDVKKELAFVRNEAALVHKEEGIQLLKTGVKSRARDAFGHFIQANSFRRGMVSTELLDKAQEEGTVNVVVEFASSGFFGPDFNTKQVFNHVNNGVNNTRFRFLRVLEPGEGGFEIDEMIQVRMNEAHIGNVQFSERIVEVSREDVFMGEAETDSGEVVKVYGTVNADYLEFNKTITSRASLEVTVIDGLTSAINLRRVIPSTYHWNQRWASYRGDKRALSDGQLEFVNRSEPRIPNPQWMYAQVSKSLAADGAALIIDRYRHLR